MQPAIGLIGVGRMGLPVCSNLVRGGHRVVATDRRRECRRAVEAAGAEWADDVATAARATQVLVTVLPGSPELAEVMAEALPALGAGTAWIDLTSASPVVVHDLAAQARAAQVDHLEAPMSGGPTAAAAGELRLLVGGSVESVERHRALLELLGEVDHVGGPGAGHTAKLLVNLLRFGQAVATAEALLLARQTGIDLDVMRRTLGRGPAASRFIDHDLEALFEGDYLESFGLDRCCEELRAVVDLAAEHGVPFELSTEVAAAYERALARYGHVDGELLAVALLEERAGVQLRPEG